MKKAIVKGALVVSGATGTIGGTAAISNQVGFEAGKNKVEVIANDHIVAGGDAKAIVALLEKNGRDAEIEQYSDVGSRDFWGRLWLVVWGK